MYLLKRIAPAIVLASLACLLLAGIALAKTSLLSQGKPVWASSALSDHPSRYANDGLARTSWVAGSHRLPQRWRVDLGTPCSLESMTIRWPQRGQVKYTISGSKDGSSYVKLFTGSGRGLMEHALSGTYRYVTVKVTDTSSTSRPRILEAQVYGKAPDGGSPSPGATASPGTWSVVRLPADDPRPSNTTAGGSTSTWSVTPVSGGSTTPAPTPSTTPAPAPSTTPTPAASAPAPAPSNSTASSVITGKTFKTYVVPTGTKNVVYDYCFFTGGLPDWNGVLTLTNPCHDITFRNCVIDSGPVNGVTIVDKGGTIYNVRFENCTFKSSKRMGFECITRDASSGGYRGIDLIGCTFEPQGSEVVSYDGPQASGNSTISGCVLKGGGTNSSFRSGGMGSGLEINGPSNMTVTNNRIYASANGLLNLQRGANTPACGWVFSDNVIDASTTYGPVSVGSNVVSAINVNGGRFARNTVISGLKSGSCIALSGCRNMDWRTTIFKDAQGRGAYATPWQEGGSSGNQF